ncbi:transglutaminase-like domain-containing protein [Tsukamurella pseudospumae]|uniref:Transglutaminase n=1 Tax=Tsukamurella pseudospumae TaxID=239498 RepID=A0A137YZ12_9ACTN|nr:transglutaminase-like domain-containing protein [Tsukamurella pseudospumae]KXO91184.1 transglutaminase [Tsukamurella pseudospumae]
MTIDYRLPGRLTDLTAVPAEALAGFGSEPVTICAPIHSLVLQPTDPAARHLSEARLAENQIRPAPELALRLLSLENKPLTELREPGQRVVGTCRHFAVLACALLRHRGIPARVRCGFATYFEEERAVDHWVIEYRIAQHDRWVRLDPEILGQTVVEHPEDLAEGLFLSGAEAWMAFRRGEIDASRFGVHGTENWGPAEIRGNLVKDLAALNKVEMLPWDEWGRMTEAYDGETGPDYDMLLDRVAAICISDDPTEIATIYRNPDLTVPDTLVCS